MPEQQQQSLLRGRQDRKLGSGHSRDKGQSLAAASAACRGEWAFAALKKQVSFIPAGVIDADGKAIVEAPAKLAIAVPAKPKTSAIKALPAPVELHLSGRVRMILIQGDVDKEALQNAVALARELA